MTPARMRLIYGVLIFAVFAAFSWWRSDLFWAAGELTLRRIQEGGAARWGVLAEVALFSGLMALTCWMLLFKADWRRDAPLAALAGAAGFAAEAWGTRTGLWTYYTGEQPPLWIIPAWALGAPVMERLSALAQQHWGARFGPGTMRAGYWALAAAALAWMSVFLWPWSHHPSAWVVLLLAAAVLMLRPAASRGFWTLAVGMLMVSLADTWGTTNNCWRYYTQQGGGAGLPGGIAFGMAFDTVLVLGCLRLVSLLPGAGTGPARDAW